MRKVELGLIGVDEHRNYLIIQSQLRNDVADCVRAQNCDILPLFDVQRFDDLDAEGNVFGEKSGAVGNAFGKNVGLFVRNGYEIAQKTVGVQPHDFDVRSKHSLFVIGCIGIHFVRIQNDAFAFLQAGKLAAFADLAHRAHHGDDRKHSVALTFVKFEIGAGESRLVDLDFNFARVNRAVLFHQTKFTF